MTNNKKRMKKMNKVSYERKKKGIFNCINCNKNFSWSIHHCFCSSTCYREFKFKYKYMKYTIPEKVLNVLKENFENEELLELEIKNNIDF